MSPLGLFGPQRLSAEGGEQTLAMLFRLSLAFTHRPLNQKIMETVRHFLYLKVEEVFITPSDTR